MVDYFKYLFLISFLFAGTAMYCQDEKISVKKQQLSEIQNEISALENELKQKTSQEKKSNAALENYNKQSHLLNTLINSLRKEEKEKQLQINKTNDQIKSLEKEIQVIQDNYSKYVIAIYKKGQYNELESILDASSLQQAIFRAQYLKKFSDKRKEDLAELEESKKLLEEKKLDLEREKKEKSLLVAQKREEEQLLKNKLKDRKRILDSIRKDRKALQSSIVAKKEAHKQIEKMIVAMVEEAKRKREIELRKQQMLASGDGTIINESELYDETPFNEYDLTTSGFSSFSELQGKIIWPLHNGKIIKRFGENRNRTLNTVTVNYGIDIQASKDENVRSVAEGIVSAINWLPGYGSVIILTHQGDYRTVYGHLAEIYVTEGDKVKAGTVLAKVGESLEGKVLHFEIWNSRINQNPESWLAKK
jgi:murein hydrolase activator